MTLIDISHYFILSGFAITLVAGLLLYGRLLTKAGFKNLESTFNDTYIKSNYPILDRLTAIGPIIFLIGVIIFLTGKFLGLY
ncbi:MAG: hypothetical protein ED557_12035 [Balneola sp.]|nr:MAG: hypothetical protein ED557_12035 [Balneola sp.]